VHNRRHLVAILVLASTLLAAPVCGQEEKDSDKLRTQTRTAKCSIGVEFGLRVVPPNSSSAGYFESVFAGVRTGLVVPSNGRIALKVKNLAVASLSGTVTFVFYRGLAGNQRVATNPDPFSFPLADPAAVTQFNHPPASGGPQAPLIDAPPGIGPRNTPLTERLRSVAIYKPDSLQETCQIEDDLVVQWSWNGKPNQGSSWPFNNPNPKQPIPRSQSRVDSPEGIIDETTGFPGQINKATQTIVLFAVSDPFGCCRTAGNSYSVIQFVRHRWKLGANKENHDEWNLDGSEKQSQLHVQGSDYDPTYTNNPGGAPNDLVQAGPWDGSGTSSAITVFDFPGLLKPDHDRFVKEGGWMHWEFITLLVCTVNPADQKRYLAAGLVQAVTHYEVTRVYTGGKETPTVEVKEMKDQPIGVPQFFKKCRKLTDVLTKDLKKAYDNPRPHTIKLL
jgi:hypothetical protein